MELKFHVGDYVRIVNGNATYRYFDEWVHAKVKYSLEQRWKQGKTAPDDKYATVMVADFHTKPQHEDYKNGRTLCYILTDDGEGYLVRDDAIVKAGE